MTSRSLVYIRNVRAEGTTYLLPKKNTENGIFPVIRYAAGPSATTLRDVKYLKKYERRNGKLRYTEAYKALCRLFMKDAGTIPAIASCVCVCVCVCAQGGWSWSVLNFPHSYGVRIRILFSRRASPKSLFFGERKLLTMYVYDEGAKFLKSNQT